MCLRTLAGGGGCVCLRTLVGGGGRRREPAEGRPRGDSWAPASVSPGQRLGRHWSWCSNTVTFSLDGSEDDVLASYQSAQRYFRYWLFCTAAHRYRVSNRLVFTTPLHGTFYYMIQHAGRYTVFVIVARQYWLVGFLNEHGFWESEWEDVVGFYMSSSRTRSTGIGFNHNDVSDDKGGGVEMTRMGVFALRDALLAMATYQGPKLGEPEGFREGFGRWIVYIMESKFKEVLYRCSDSMIRYTYSRLGPGTKWRITSWSSECEFVMVGIEEGFDSEEKIAKAKKILEEILILYVDSCEGKEEFKHLPLPPKPRYDTWEPVDQGDGDRRIPNPDAATSQPETRPRYERSKAGRKRGMIAAVEEEKIQKRAKTAGLRGGGVGGSALVPDWFLNWDENKNNEGLLEELIRRSSALGIQVGEAHLRLKTQSINQQQPALNPSMIMQRNQSRVVKQDTKMPYTCQPSISLRTEQSMNQQQRAHDPSMVMPRNQSSAAKQGSIPTPLVPQQPLPGTTILPSDIEDLRGNQFVNDTVISTYFDRLAETIPDDTLYLVPPAISNAFSWNPTGNTMNIPYLASRGLSIFPVNNGNPNRADSGLHWSVVLLDLTDVASPRLIHHDSSPQEINRAAAERLENALRQVLPFQPGNLILEHTPLQENGYDCAIYVSAITTMIADWWKNRDGEPTWVPHVTSHVTSTSVARMRELLPEFFINGMSIQNLIKNCFVHEEDQSMVDADR